MLKHFLWFSRKPADEREAVILSVAYQRALAATWIGLVVFLFAASPYSGVLRTVSVEHVITLLELALLAGMFAGWTAVRREHLEFKPVSHAHRFAFWKLAVVWLVATFAGMLPILVQPRLFYVSVFSVFVVYVVSTMVWAANWTKSYTPHSRLLAVVLLPFQTIGFLLEPKAGLAKRALFTIVLTVGVIGVPVAAWVPFMDSVVMAGGFAGPVAVGYEHSEGFVPAVIDYRIVGGIREGDLVEFNPDISAYDMGIGFQKQRANNFVYGVVTAVGTDTVTLEVLDAVGETSDSATPDITTQFRQHHTEEVPVSRVFAKVITDAPLSGWLYRQ